jgi:hypothetical protein
MKAGPIHSRSILRLRVRALRAMARPMNSSGMRDPRPGAGGREPIHQLALRPWAKAAASSSARPTVSAEPT